MRKVPKQKIVVADDFRLRGVLKCFCSKPLTGAPSRNGAGNYYNYYKYPVSGHNTLNANKAHEQLEEALNYMSLPAQLVREIKDATTTLLEQSLFENKRLLQHIKVELDQLESKLHSVESKWIGNEIAHDTYHRWHGELTEKIRLKKAESEKLGKDEDEVYLLLQNELDKLSD